MKRRSRCEWMPMLPWPIWPLAGHARLGQNVVVGSMTILLSWLCWGASQEEVCLDPCFLCNLTPPRFSVELPFYETVFVIDLFSDIYRQQFGAAKYQKRGGYCW